MKKIFAFFSVVALGFNLNAQIEISSTGNIAMGTTPNDAYKLYVSGKGYFTNNIGVGVAPNSTYKLYVNGYARFNSSVGIGIAPYSSYKLYVNGNSYFNSAVGIGTTPNSTYKLNVGGEAKIGNLDRWGNSFIFDDAGYYGSQCIRPNGNTGSVGTSSNPFQSMNAYAYYTISDSRQKENLRDINKPLEKLLSLKGVKYDIKKKYAVNTDSIADPKIMKKLEKTRYDNLGFLAQDVMGVLPEAIFYDEVSDVYAVNYTRVIPVLVEAMKEQQGIIEELKKEIDKLKKQNRSSLNIGG